MPHKTANGGPHGLGKIHWKRGGTRGVADENGGLEACAQVLLGAHVHHRALVRVRALDVRPAKRKQLYYYL